MDFYMTVARMADPVYQLGIERAKYLGNPSPAWHHDDEMTPLVQDPRNFLRDV
jgi:hypothetical protein